MSSLLAMIRKGKLLLPVSADLEWKAIVRNGVLDAVKHTTIHVDINSVSDEAYGDRSKLIWGEIPCITPQYSEMWFEFHKWNNKFGVLAYRQDAPLGFHINFLVFSELWGEAAIAAGIFISADSKGRYVSGAHMMLGHLGGLSEDEMTGPYGSLLVAANSAVFIACHAICRLHCKGVKLSQRPEGKIRKRFTNKPAPACVWHTIDHTNAAQIKHQFTGLNVFRDELKMREFRVRGHYADYRETGLFGRESMRGLYWIPDHRRGNPDLGTVIPEYRV